MNEYGKLEHNSIPVSLYWGQCTAYSNNDGAYIYDACDGVVENFNVSQVLNLLHQGCVIRGLHMNEYGKLEHKSIPLSLYCGQCGIWDDRKTLLDGLQEAGATIKIDMDKASNSMAVTFTRRGKGALRGIVQGFDMNGLGMYFPTQGVYLKVDYCLAFNYRTKIAKDAKLYIRCSGMMPYIMKYGGSSM